VDKRESLKGSQTKKQKLTEQNETTVYQNSQDTAKAARRGKFLALNACI